MIVVSTKVTDAPKDNALPFSVTIAVLPTVEKTAPAWVIMVPTIVPPPAALIVAALPLVRSAVPKLIATLLILGFGTANH